MKWYFALNWWAKFVIKFFVLLGQSFQYWPSSIDIEKMGDFTLELTEQHNFEDYTAREINIVETTVSKSVPTVSSLFRPNF